jgi:hypothetical protein
MTSSERDRALRLIEREDRINEQRAEREREAAEGSRLRDAIRRVKKHDAEIAAEQARREAAQEADELAVRRAELEGRMEAEATALNRSISELEALDRRHRDALRRAGRNPGHSNSLHTLLPRWFKHRFGGFNSPTGIPGSHPSGKEHTLPERDPLASP